MNISPLQIDVFVLSFVVGTLVLTVWLFRRFPMQSWYENRLPWLFPKNFVIAMETLAQQYPCQYLFTMFFSLLGAFSLILDLKSVFGYSIYLSPLLRYSVSACVALFSLYTHRINARRRAA